jgi:AAA family ATP:ADP antiporter
MVIMLMFWSFANHITSVDEAKKSYTIYIAAGNFAAATIGPILYLLKRSLGHLNFSYTVQATTAIVTVCGLLVIGIYSWVNRYVLTDPRHFQPREEDEVVDTTKKKTSLWESFKTIAKSKNLFHIAVLVIAYGLTISIVEVTWKAHVKLFFSNPSDYQPVMGMIVSSVGFVSFLLSFFVCGNIIRWLGWHFTAQISPIILGITGIMFFTVVIYQQELGSFFQHFGMTPLLFIVMFGAIQNVASKVMKYSFFDPTKEMVYIPLSDDEKVKGKASIDLVGSRLGKSGSSWIQVALFDLVGTGSVLGITAYLLPIVAFTVIFWSYSVYRLNFYFNRKSSSKPETQVG